MRRIQVVMDPRAARRNRWPFLTLGLLAVLTIAAAAQSGLADTSSNSASALAGTGSQGRTAQPAAPDNGSPGSPRTGGPGDPTVPPGSSVSPASVPPTTSGDPSPVATTAPAPVGSSPSPGGPIHAQPAARCEESWDGESATPGSALAEQLEQVLVPAGPTGATICRYAGLNQKAARGQLERSRVLSGSEFDAFVGYLDSTQWQKVTKGAINCPMSEGSVDGVIFDYADHIQVRLTVDIGGCSFASNGQLTVWGGDIGQQLSQWVGADAPA